MEGRPQPRLTVELASFEADEAFSKSHAGAHVGRYARLTVGDNGHGMDRPTLERIYEPFFTTKAPGKGTGLGLAVVHGIVQKHDGLVTVESQPGEGTVFRLYFPEHLGTEKTGPISAQPVVQGGGEHILAVDDEEPIARMIGRLLAKLGYKTTTLSDPEKALEMFQSKPQDYDLIMTDLTMPGMTGIELATLAKQRRPDIPVILMTGYYTNLSQQQLEASGVREVLMKPVDLKSLSVVVDQILKTRKGS